MRVWHIPMQELDNLRIRSQHNEIHMILSHLAKAHQGVVVTPWAYGEGIYALTRLHDIIVYKIWNETPGDHRTPVMLSCTFDMIRQYQTVIPWADEYMWPPIWTSVRQQVADVRDLQARWTNWLSKHPQLETSDSHSQPRQRVVDIHNLLEDSINKYGLHLGGKLHGEATYPEDITQQDVATFIENLVNFTATVDRF